MTSSTRTRTTAGGRARPRPGRGPEGTTRGSISTAALELPRRTRSGRPWTSSASLTTITSGTSHRWACSTCLAEQHDQIIVLDDVAEILANRIALQLLLAALGNQPNATGVRLVKYRQARPRRDGEVYRWHHYHLKFELHAAPLLEALKSRVHYLRYDPTDEQIAALMRKSLPKVALKPKLSPEECRQVAEFLIAESQRIGCRLDIRLLVEKALPDYAQ